MQTNEKPGGRSRDRVKGVTRVRDRVRGVIRVRDRVRASDEYVIRFSETTSPPPPPKKKKVEKLPS